MDALVDLILNGSTELDAPAIVRLIDSPRPVPCEKEFIL